MSVSDPAPAPNKGLVALPLSAGKRWLLAAFGIPAVSSVVVAGFYSNDGPSLTAVGVGGALAVIMAAIGVQPRRVQFGDKSIDFGVVEAVVDTTVAALPQSDVERVGSAFEALADGEVMRLARRRVAQHLLFHQAVIGVVREVAAELGAAVEEEATSGDERWDAVMRSAGSVVFVEAVLRLDASAASAAGARARTLPEGACALLIYLEQAADAEDALGEGPVTILFEYHGEREELADRLTSLLKAPVCD